jgi:hypothetical protein
MPIIPQQWSVVIIGAWNRAILTPSGIATRLFLLPVGTAVQVLVPLDAVAPYQVRHNDITVVASSDRLLVHPEASTYEGLASAMEVVRRALDDLPRTPMSAAGYNLRFKSEGPVEVLTRLLTHSCDDEFSDAQYFIQERELGRTLRHGNGRIKVSVTQEEDLSFSLLLNFDMQTSDVAHIRQWVNEHPDTIRQHTERILFQCLGLNREDFADA